MPGLGYFPDDGGMETGGIPGFACQQGREHDGVVTQGFSVTPGRIQRLKIVSDNHMVCIVEDRVARLGGFFDVSLGTVDQMPVDGFGKFFSDVIFGKDLHAVLKCAGVWNRGPRSNDIQVITDNVGQNQ